MNRGNCFVFIVEGMGMDGEESYKSFRNGDHRRGEGIPEIAVERRPGTSI
jgi:hypothetical protein